MRNEAEIIWSRAVKKLKSMLNDDVFKLWFAPIKPSQVENGTLILEVANDFCEVWLKDNYHQLLEEVVEDASGQRLQVSYQCKSSSEPSSPQATQSAQANPSESKNIGGHAEGQPSQTDHARRASTPDTATAKFNPFYTFDSFVVGANNRMAYSAALAVAQSPGKSYNPLFLYGGVGLGKTHLLHAIGQQVIGKRPNARVSYLSCEKFTNEFIRAIQENTLTKFRSRYRSVDYLLIDDIQFLAGKERIQEEFFHTFNDIYDSQRQIFLTSDRPAGEIDKIESRLLSRFQWGLVADIQAPDLETRVAILTRKADAMGISVEPEIIEFLAKNISRNVRRMEGALTRVAGYVGLTRKKADLDTVQRLLRDILREENLSRITMETIQKKVVDYYHLRMADMLSRRRPANIAFPRQVAMYLSRILTEHSLQEIGNAFGGRDHGTVIHACKTVENMMDQDTSIKHAVEFLNEQLSQAME